jgi:hypothetical protein
VVVTNWYVFQTSESVTKEDVVNSSNLLLRLDDHVPKTVNRTQINNFVDDILDSLHQKLHNNFFKASKNHQNISNKAGYVEKRFTRGVGNEYQDIFDRAPTLHECILPIHHKKNGEEDSTVTNEKIEKCIQFASMESKLTPSSTSMSTSSTTTTSSTSTTTTTATSTTTSTTTRAASSALHINQASASTSIDKDHPKTGYWKKLLRHFEVGPRPFQILLSKAKYLDNNHSKYSKHISSSESTSTTTNSSASLVKKLYEKYPKLSLIEYKKLATNSLSNTTDASKVSEISEISTTILLHAQLHAFRVIARIFGCSSSLLIPKIHALAATLEAINEKFAAVLMYELSVRLANNPESFFSHNNIFVEDKRVNPIWDFNHKLPFRNFDWESQDISQTYNHTMNRMINDRINNILVKAKQKQQQIEQSESIPVSPDGSGSKSPQSNNGQDISEDDETSPMLLTVEEEMELIQRKRHQFIQWKVQGK